MMILTKIENKEFPQDEMVSPATQGLLVFVRDHSILTELHDFKKPIEVFSSYEPPGDIRRDKIK